jgi:spoIIIJ-associated protein
MNRSQSQNPVKISAKSLEQALVKAAGVLGITQDELAYELIKDETANRGLLSFFKSPQVEISAWNKKSARPVGAKPDCCAPKKDAKSGRPERAPRRERDDHDDEIRQAAEPLSPEKLEALTAELRDFCAGIVSHMSGEPATVSGAVEDGRLVLDVDNAYFADQIAKNSKLAEAMEHILRKKPRHLRQELPFRIFIDVSGQRKQREADLIQMAHDLSAKVHENKRPIVLNYKSSYDRKIIHMALDKDDRVYTKSIGSGPNRKLMILPSKDGASQGMQQPVELEDRM